VLKEQQEQVEHQELEVLQEHQVQQVLQVQQERVEHQESMVLKVPLEHREPLVQVEQQVLQVQQELAVHQV
jgi:hypothetical protein